MLENSTPNPINQEKSVKTHSAIVINNQSVESYFQTSHKNYTLALLLFTFLSSFAYLYIVAQYQNMYFVQCSQCKSTFFGSFYFYFMFTFAHMVVYFKNLKTDVFDPKSSILMLGSFKYILSVFGSQMFFATCFFVTECVYCSDNMVGVVMNLFLYQAIQYTIQFIISFIYLVKTYREIEAIQKQNAEKAQKKTIELFNASFALNETKSEANYGARVNQNQYMTRLDMNQSNTNTSQFTTSYGDNTKMVSVFSADSMLNVSKLQGFKRSPKMRRFNMHREVDK